MVLNQVQYPGCNLSATRNAGLDLVGVILCLCANQPKVQHRKPMCKCLPKNAIVEDVQGSRGQPLNKGIGKTGIVNRANGKGLLKREQGIQHPMVVLMEFSPDCCQLIHCRAN